MGNRQTARATALPTPIDTLVIGAGLAGLTAALRSAQQGATTLLLAKGMGSLSWTHGCIDLWPAPRPLAALKQLPADHPYQRAGSAAITDACAWFSTLTQTQQQRYVGSPEQAVEVCTALGSWNTVSLLPLSMIAAQRSVLETGPVLVAGFRELRDFYPPLLAARLQAQGIDARPFYLAMPPTQRVHEFTPIHLARLFDQPAFRAAVGRQLQQHQGTAHVVLLPAVLGLDQTTQVITDLQSMAGALIGEVPTLPTVIPGLRLERMLQNALAAAGGRILINAEVTRGEWDGTTLKAVWSQAAAREIRHTADQVMLATGGIAGGGLRADYPDLLRETALDLPVQQPPTRAAWFAPQASADQPVYRAGIAINEHFQPLDQAQAVVAANVAVIGAAIAGFDLIRQRCHNGVALATAWAATQQHSQV